MHTIEDEKNIKEYEKYILRNGIDRSVIDAYCEASKIILCGRKDREYGLKVSTRAKELIFEYIKSITNGADFNWLETQSQKNKQSYDILDKYYDLLLYEAPYILDSYILYIEKNRPKKERFYEPRRKTLKQVVDKLQELEDGKLDELFIHMAPRVGKSQIITLAMSWHCAKDAEKSNLYVTYKEGLGGAFLTGVMEIWTDPTYCFSDVFPKIKVADTDSKNHKVDLVRKKKYKTLSGKGLESGLNGEYDAYGWMVLDDILEGIQDVLNPDTLKRKQIIFDNNVMSRKKEQCKLIHNGTIWSLHDLYSDRLDFLQNNPEAKNIRYDILKIPALDENDESNFDYDYGVGYTTQYYRTLRAKFEENDDMASWYAQYQQEPIERDGAVFNPEYMRFYNVCIILVAHKRKDSGIDDEDMDDSIRGDSDIVNSAGVIIHYNVNKDENTMENYPRIISVTKNRVFGRTSYRGWKVHYDEKSKRIYGDNDDLNICLGWDNESGGFFEDYDNSIFS